MSNIIFLSVEQSLQRIIVSEGSVGKYLTYKKFNSKYRALYLVVGVPLLELLPFFRYVALNGMNEKYHPYKKGGVWILYCI